ncbi:hypothetical protein H7R52_14150 [Weissella confusa]|uniref:DUF1542 domain-containing protein n=1 Tax=Weissella confusa TaxID=1583 RepID=A0A923NGU1_WEICO|nr:hypothetical protein [Weissella confusa]
MEDRDAAKLDAQNAITNALGSDQSAEPAIQAAIKNLQDVIKNANADSPDALTEDIKEQKIAELQTAVTAAAKTQEEARNSADDAKQQTAPVTNEPAVQTALDELNEVLNNPASTADAIKQATAQALTDATNTAKADRDAANQKADTAISKAQNSNQGAEQTVQDAIRALQEVQEEAANDSADALTADIFLDDIQALKNAEQIAWQNQSSARSRAEEAMDNTPAVTNEATVQSALDNQNNVLNNPSSTVAEIDNASTQQLLNATAADKSNRSDANRQANTAIRDAQNSNQAGEPEVIIALQKLKDAQALAANDSSAALTQTHIIDVTKALQDVVNVAATSQEDARQAAETALGDTAPVSNEVATSAAGTELNTVLNDPAATVTAIKEPATKLLQDAVDDANTQRNAANSNAVSAINAASASNQADEPEVQAAVQKLQDLIDQAASDSADALTQ